MVDDRRDEEGTAGSGSDADRHPDEPESHTAYLTTVDGAFPDDSLDEEVVAEVLDGREDMLSAPVRGAHDAQGKAGSSKGSVVFGEGAALPPRSFGGREDPAPPSAPPMPPAGFDALSAIPLPPDRRTARSAVPDGTPAHQRKGTRMRRILVLIAVAVIGLLVALCVLAYQYVMESRTIASQQTVSGQSTSSSKTSVAAKRTDVPSLTVLLGMTEDQALAQIARGATVTASSAVAQPDSKAVTRVTVALTTEPADAKSGVPTVYLGLDANGLVVAASYTATVPSLGYGTLSFADAIDNAHIVEKTLSRIGLNVSGGTVDLPDNRTAYSTFDSDGATLVKESYAFAGTASATDGSGPYAWTASVDYDYAAANASGNLVDTVRQITVGVTS